MIHQNFLSEHLRLTRRFFLQAGFTGGVIGSCSGLRILAANEEPAKSDSQYLPGTESVRPDSYFTRPTEFRDVSRGTPLPHSLSDEKKIEVGLTRDTWRLEVISDQENPATLGKQFSKATGTEIDFGMLLKLAEKRAVRFAKVMTCLNLGCPLGMGLWEGVPLREIVWLTQPRENLRRVFYYGYHNDDPKQMFRSSLPIGRVLEDYFDLPPVIVCYKLNGEWLDSERGGPVRIVVPEAYGFKSIKWLTHIVLTNLATANDTYADQNNDVDGPIKTFASTLTMPAVVTSGKTIHISGYAQVGISGLSKVQVWIQSQSAPHPQSDPNFETAPWVDAEILPAPEKWDCLRGGKIPIGTHGFDEAGVPQSWPMRFTLAHWVAVLPGLKKGDYTFRCRTIDEHGQAQPMPRPFRKSGHAAIESVDFKIEE